MNAMLYADSIITLVWGVAHIVPTKSVVKGFGPTSEENRRIITMEWVAEGATLCFIGLLTLLVTSFAGPQGPLATIVCRVSPGMLIAMAVLTALTGARTSIVPIKVCPIIKAVAAVLFLVGSIL